MQLKAKRRVLLSGTPIQVPLSINIKAFCVGVTSLTKLMFDILKSSYVLLICILLSLLHYLLELN